MRLGDGRFVFLSACLVTCLLTTVYLQLVITTASGEQELQEKQRRLQHVEHLPETALLNPDPQNLHDDGQVAFLIFSKSGTHQAAAVWRRYFTGVPDHLYSLYAHTAPGVVFTEQLSTTVPVHSHPLPIATRYRSRSMAEGIVRLLQFAVEHDSRNQVFVLLSDSCVPLRPFAFLYQYLLRWHPQASFFESYAPHALDPSTNQSRGYDWKVRYFEHELQPAVMRDRFRKGASWFALSRVHAEHMFTPEHRQWLTAYSFQIAVSTPEHLLQNFFDVWPVASGTLYLKAALTFARWHWNNKSNQHPFEYEGSHEAYHAMISHSEEQLPCTCDHCFLVGRKMLNATPESDLIQRLPDLLASALPNWQKNTCPYL